MNRIDITVLAIVLGVGATSTAQQRPSRGPETAAAHLKRGIELAESGQMESAATEFKSASRLDPGSAESLVWLGITQNQLDHFHEAVSAFSAALKINSGLQTAHYNLALSYARLDQRQKAISELEMVVKASPSMTSAQYNLAVLFEQEGKSADAIAHLEAARQQRPEDPEIGLHLVADYFKTSQDQQAAQIAKDAFERDRDPVLAARLGSILVEGGRFHEAVPMLEFASHSKAPSPEITNLLARAYIGSHTSPKAIALLMPLASSDSSGESAYLLGLAYASDKQPGPAMDAFRIAADRKPADAPVHFHLGAVLLQSPNESDYAAGVKELQKAIDLAPREGSYYAALGRWLLEHDQVSAATSTLRRGIENAPALPDLYVLLSVAEVVSQSTQLAQPTVEKAIALDPQIPLAYDVLGFCYFRVGDYPHAAESYKKASDLNPRSGRFAYDIALAFERGNKPTEALPYADRAAKDDPQVSMNHYLLGKLYSKLEKKPESVRELEKAIQLNPQLDYPYYLLARMYMRIGNIAKAQELNQKLQALKKQQMTVHGVGGMSSEPETQATPSMLLGVGQMDPEQSDSTQDSTDVAPEN